MYPFIAAVMVVLPIGSVVVAELHAGDQADLLLLAGRWFIFQAVGVRLFVAGLRQSFQPAFTAGKILGIAGSEADVVVRELGFPNLAMGTVALLSLRYSAWVPAAAVAGGIFIGAAAVNHLFRKQRNPLQQVVTFSNLLVLVVLVAYGVRLLGSQHRRGRVGATFGAAPVGGPEVREREGSVDRPSGYLARCSFVGSCRRRTARRTHERGLARPPGHPCISGTGRVRAVGIDSHRWVALVTIASRHPQAGVFALGVGPLLGSLAGSRFRVGRL